MEAMESKEAKKGFKSGDATIIFGLQERGSGGGLILAEIEAKNGSTLYWRCRRSRGIGGRSDLIAIFAMIIISAAAFLVYSNLSIFVPTSPQNFEASTATPTVSPRPTAPPQTDELIAGVGVAETPTPSPSGAGDCKLFKNKYTSELKCISCVVQAAGNPNAYDPNAGCIYTSRDWVEVAGGSASGYYCVFDATLALGCKTLRA